MSKSLEDLHARYESTFEKHRIVFVLLWGKNENSCLTWTERYIASHQLSEFENLKDVASDIKVPRETLIYAYENRREIITRRKGRVKVFYIKWLER